MRRLLIVLGVLVVAAAAAAATFLVRERAYRGEALPGVRVLPAHLGARVNVEAAGGRIRLVPAAVLRLDRESTRQRTLAAGRASVAQLAEALLLPAPPTHTIHPVLRLRWQPWARLVRRLDGWGRPAHSARVEFNGIQPVVVPARSGTRADARALLDALASHVETGHSTIQVRYRTALPAIGDAAARAAAVEAAQLVSAPVRLTSGGAAAGMLSPSQLAPLVRFRPEGAHYIVGFDPSAAADALRPLVQRWHREPVNARFDVTGSAVRVIPAQPGRDVDPAVAADLLLAGARSPGRVASVAMHAVPAALTTAKAKALGIRQRLVSFTTEMGPSSSNRIHNVHLMADFIDGTIIKPGEVFSYNSVVGPRTSDRGFLEGQMIVGSLTLPAIGGGVCQTATTLFNDAFELGLPILERTNHGYYLSHYPLGRDATVSWGGPDLKFRNDLQHGLLIKSSYTDSTLTFTFYGTPQGRQIVSSTGPQHNWTAPQMSYAIDPQAPAGSVQVVSGSGEQGFDVTVSRKVYEHGKLLRSDSFPSHYIPVGPTTVYGPGATPPGPYVVLPPY